MVFPLLYLATRFISFLVAYIAPFFIPYLGFFPYKAELDVYPEPDWVTSFANFDGIHYMTIAGQGYQQYEEAYFPLYSILMHFVAPVFNKDYLLAGLIVSGLACTAGLYFFYNYLKLVLKNTAQAKWALAFLIVFPSAFFFNAVYTESLFLCMTGGYLYFFMKSRTPASHKKGNSTRHALFAGLFGYLAALTRLVGVFMIIPFLAEHFISAWQKKKTFMSSLNSMLSDLAKNPITVIPFFTPILGLLTYMGYLLIKTGDPLYFLTTQPVFGANRSTSIILLPQVIYRYIKIFLTADKNYQYLGAVIEFTLFSFVFGLLCLEAWKLWQRRHDSDIPARVGLNLFSFANIILPTLTGTLTSTPRYALFCLSIYLFLGELQNTKLKVAILTIFSLLYICLLGLFIQGYFVG